MTLSYINEHEKQLRFIRSSNTSISIPNHSANAYVPSHSHSYTYKLDHQHSSQVFSLAGLHVDSIAVRQYFLR